MIPHTKVCSYCEASFYPDKPDQKYCKSCKKFMEEEGYDDESLDKYD